MLYIDQPVGVGFSYGPDNVNTTAAAAPYVYKLLQAFYARFPEYKSRDFGIFTESYGGHYGPSFAKYILDQNDLVAAGNATGQHVNLIALGLNNGWIDPYDNYMGMIDFALNNTYRPLINETQAKKYYDKMNSQCMPQLQACNNGTGNNVCMLSLLTCKSTLELPLSSEGDFDVYDVRKPAMIGADGVQPSFPPQTYEKYLHMPEIQSAIGASQKYDSCPRPIQTRFLKTGDGISQLTTRVKLTCSDSITYLPALEHLVNRNVTTVLWAGDADFICNWKANLYTANKIQYQGREKFNKMEMQPYKVNGKTKGTFKIVDNLSYLRVFEAGHTLMAFRKYLHHEKKC
jgi:carboxypeptidase C (cathepsin A)